MNSPECLITGCRLVDKDRGRSVWGDLHICGGVYIFNALLDTTGNNHCGEAAWDYESCRDEDSTEKQLLATPYFSPFERRGIIVFPRHHAIFNKAAEEFLKAWVYRGYP